MGELHRMAVAYVNATAQAAAYDRIAPLLTEQEQAVYRPGPQRWGPIRQKTPTPATMPRRPGWRRFFGYLYLNGAQERAQELFEAITANKENAKQN